MHRLGLYVALTVTAGRLVAQAPAVAVKGAAETITADDIARHVNTLADDSMMGRDTPSRGLELAAQYVADNFKKFGLRPAGDNGGWFQHYTIARRQLDPAQSRVVFAAKGQEAAAGFQTSALLSGVVAGGMISGTPTLIAGPHTPASVAKLKLRDQIVLYVAPDSGDSTVRPRVVQALRQASKVFIILTRLDSAAIAARTAQAAGPRTLVGNPPATIAVQPNPVRGVLTTAGVDLAEARAAATPVARPVTGLTVRVEVKDSILSAVEVPNTVGILEGTDPKLKNEYVVFSAHMDHLGIGDASGQPDSIYNGADDNASGTSGVLELAEAFSQAGARPRRSLIFATMSGEEKGLLGSGYFVDHPPVPLGQMVADFTMDMIGRKWVDTIWAVAGEHSDLGATLQRVSAAHPELQMTPIPDPRPGGGIGSSDQYSFARKGVPVIKFGNGPHPDYHQVTDSPDKINADKASRIVRLMFYLGEDVANADQRPKWNEESYRKIVQ